ncbi:MAG: type II secretion system GspH family protein [Synergistaceae bacterium]|jgi:prepilin-type N-terminal cleavage/methylation domain-containing protein|nr:type II secretion system GspH family protein [Synergistaceae bacterium]
MKTSSLKRRNGFTLVELIVVSVIIGVLAGMMMLVSGPSTGGAAAAALIYDLRLIKAASMQYYYDHGAMPSDGLAPGASTELAAYIEKYMDQGYDGSYGGVIYYAHENGKIYYGLLPDEFTEKAKEKLQANGLIYTSTGDPYAGGAGPFYMIVK